MDIHSPRPPFVLFKVLFRLVRESFLGTIFYPFYLLLSALLHILASVVGYLVGFVFGGEGGGEMGGGGNGAGIRQPVSRDARIPRPVWGPDLSMMDDEYL